MLKNISNLGKALSREEQKSINGGRKICTTDAECGPNGCCQAEPGCTSTYCNDRNHPCLIAIEF